MNKHTPLKMVVVGGGAISQEWHIPILMGRVDVELKAVIDRSGKTQELLRKAYPSLAVFTDVSELTLSDFDCAIVATPVAFHYQITKQLLEAGKHVLVEKPIALNAIQGEELVSIAENKGLTLGVSLYRRLYPSLSVLRNLIESKAWGEVQSFTFNWGDIYSWSASSLGNMTKELAGGGTLMDLGPHALDWLCELFGHEVQLLEYRDDAVSGIETDCSLSLKFNYCENTINGTLNLSRIRKLGGEILVICENADLTLSVGERFKVTVLPKGAQSNNLAMPLAYECYDQQQPEEEWFETFAREHDDFIGAINGDIPQRISGQSVMAAANIIDECYATKQNLSFDWNNTEHLSIPELSELKSIFITGASGFVGGRLVEILSEQSDIQIFAGINNPNKATRLSRYNINLVQFDLNDLSSIDSILQKCDAVVHCAIGTAYGDDASVYKTTVEGTANLIEAAERNKVQKFVHLSSLAAVDMSANPLVLNEENSVDSTETDIYAVSKRDAEKRVISHAEHSKMQITILRPTTIYGPHSPLFMIGAGKQAIENGICLSKIAAASPSNSVYIDNLILCILARLNSASKALSCYFINDDDGFTYKDFYSYFTNAFDTQYFEVDSVAGVNAQAKKGVLSELLSETKGVIKSKELRKLALKVFNAKKLGFPARWVVEKFPGIESKLRDESGTIFVKRSEVEQLMPLDASTSATVQMTKFEQEHPELKKLDRRSALANTESWLKFCFNK